MLDLHRLTFLRELAARGTVTAVAEALSYTPSAVSQQLSTLEREVGVRLLERQGRRLALTAAGRALVAGADEVFRAAEHATSAAVAAAATLAGPVAVGSFASVGATVVPAAFASLRHSHPALDLRFRQCQDEGLRELQLGALDIWIDQHYTALPGPDVDRLAEHQLLVEPVCIAVPTADDRGPDLAAYRGDAWAGDAPDSACGRLLHRLSGDAGFVPEVRYLTGDLEVISQLVAAGVAVAVLPRLAMTRMPDGVTVHPLPGVERRVVALTRTASTERPAVALVVAELERAGETAAAYRVRP